MCRLTGVKCRYKLPSYYLDQIKTTFARAPFVFVLMLLTYLVRQETFRANIQGCVPDLGSIRMI